jgi:hypothetical protein
MQVAMSVSMQGVSVPVPACSLRTAELQAQPDSGLHRCISHHPPTHPQVELSSEAKNGSLHTSSRASNQRFC